MRVTLLVCLLACEAGATYSVRHFTLSPDTPEALQAAELRSAATGELLHVITGSGGKTARLQLRSPVTGELREVLEPLTDAGAIRDTANGIHYAGSILAPFANRVANGTYSFFGKRHELPRNECPAGVRCDALHGFLFNRSMAVLAQEAGPRAASLTLGYQFDGTDTPGWPFRAAVNVTYTLRAVRSNASAVSIRVRALNLQSDGQVLPWTASWHPYFRVSDVSATRLAFDSCGGDGAWSHLLSGPGAPRKGDLIPTGRVEPWRAFDGATPIGGTPAAPTYFDDEYVLAFATAQPRCAGGGVTQSIHDGPEAIRVRGDGMQFSTWQLFTGAKEGWGWDAIALEPMSGLADAFNNGDGLSVLAPGEAFDGQFSVELGSA